MGNSTNSNDGLSRAGEKGKVSLDRIGRVTLLKLASDLVGRLIQFVLVVVAARLLDPATFGDYVFSLTVGLILGQLSDFGLQLLLFRTLSTSSSTSLSRQALGEFLAARAILAGFASVVGLLFVGSMDRAAEVRVAVELLIVATILGSVVDTLFYVFRAYSRIQYEVAISLASRSLVLLFGSAAMLAGFGMMGLALAQLFFTTATLICCFALIQTRILSPSWPGSIAPVMRALGRAIPIGGAVAASLLYFRLDVILLQWLRSPEEVAVYGVAYKLFEPTLIIPGAVLAVAFPVLARAASHPRTFLSFGARLVCGLLAIALFLVVGGFAVAQLLIPLLFGETYAASVGLLQVLLLGTIPMFVNYVLTHGFIALNRTWYNAAFAVGALGINLSANLLLIPSMGALGAAIVTVLTEVTLLVLCSLGLMREWSRLRRRGLLV